MITLLVAGAAAWLQAQATPAAAFGFANTGGDLLLAWEAVAEPSQLTRAACQGGRMSAVQWIRHQDRGRRSTGRETEHNFEQVAGEVFRTTPAVAPGGVCLLMSDAFARVRQVQAVRAAGECDERTRARLAAAKGRAVTGCWSKGEIAGRRLALAEFERQGKGLLASLALVGPEEVAFDDYAAEWDAAGISCWRVDDGCELVPEAIHVLFVYVTAAGGQGLAVAWDGAESQALRLLEVDGPRLRDVLTASRYWAPQ